MMFERHVLHDQPWVLVSPYQQQRRKIFGGWVFFLNLFCSFFLHLWYFGPFLSTRLTLRLRSLEYRYGNLRIFFVTQYFPFSLSSKIFRDKLNLFQEVEGIIPLRMIVHVQIIFSMEAIFKSDFLKPNRKVNSRLNFTLKESFLIL